MNLQATGQELPDMHRLGGSGTADGDGDSHPKPEQSDDSWTRRLCSHVQSPSPSSHGQPVGAWRKGVKLTE